MAIKPPPPTSSSPQTTLHPPTLPAATFAKLSPTPYLLAHLQPTHPHLPPHRPSGRTPHEFRPPTIHTGSLTHTSGSAVVRVGDTAVVCGVRGEILLAHSIPHPPPRRSAASSEEASVSTAQKAAEELAALGLLVPNLTLSTGCSPAHLPGSAPSPLSQSLAQRILTLLHSSGLVALSDLTIWHHAADDAGARAPKVKAYWTLYIDVLFISLDGNPFDAAWGAVVAALGDTRLPAAWWDAEGGGVVCDGDGAAAGRLRLGGWPVGSSFAVFAPGARVGRGGTTGRGGGKDEGTWVLADPDGFEEGVCREMVTVVVDVEEGRTKVLRVEKWGGGVVGGEEMRGLVGMAEGRWREWRGVLGGK